MSAILELPIINSPAMWIIYAVAIALTVTLLVRRNSKSKHGKTKRWPPRALIGIVAGAVVGFLIYLAGNALDLFGVDLPGPVGAWAAATFAGIGLAVASFPTPNRGARSSRASRSSPTSSRARPASTRSTASTPPWGRSSASSKKSRSRSPTSTQTTEPPRHSPSPRRGRHPPTCRPSASAARFPSPAPHRASWPGTRASTCPRRPWSRTRQPSPSSS